MNCLQQFQRFFNNRFIIIVLLLIIIFLIYFRGLSPLSSSQSSSPITTSRITQTLKDNLKPKISLVQLNKKYHTSKGSVHRYTRFYEHYLSKYQNTDFHLLEIGLGCGMSWGVGVSAALWREYFGPKANIHFIEYDKKCGEKWMDKSGRKLNITMHYGSQDDLSFLEAFGNNYTDFFDAIIDDGGHRMTHQINSLTVFFPTILRSGGTYAIEDIYTSYLPEYGGEYLKSSTLIELLKKLTDDIQSKSPTHKKSALGKLIYSFEIGDKICLLTKK